MKVANPFIVGRYVGDEYFCDRVEETAFLEKQVTNGRDVTIISPRRMGKSGLIKHFFNKDSIKENYETLFVDIYATATLGELVAHLGCALLEKIAARKSVFMKALDVVKSLRPMLTWDAMSGEPSVELTVGKIVRPELTLDEIFQYFEQSEKTFIVAFDEFQQIMKYDSDTVEGRLRTLMQRCVKTRFIFAGSEQSLMTEMFQSSRKPFYQTTIAMSLHPLDRNVYCEFACRLFKERGKSVEPVLVSRVYEEMEGVTWFVQMLMNEIFAITPENGAPSDDALHAAMVNIIGVQTENYQELMARLSARQRQLLCAIAAEPQVGREPTSAASLELSGFKTAAMVQSALRALLKEGLVTKTAAGYSVYDKFLHRWLSGGV